MYLSTICIIFCVSYIHSASCGHITEKLKLAQDSAVQSDACPPGVWTCSTGKRSEIGKASKDSKVLPNEKMTTEQSSNFDGSEDPQDCSPGMWVCKKERMLKQMLKTALKNSKYIGHVAKINPSQVSNDACPSGVWTCSTGKRSEIIKEVQVAIFKASVLDESF